jgi:hypothetical protein
VTALPIATVGDPVLREQFDRHRREEFLRRVAPYTRERGA